MQLLAEAVRAGRSFGPIAVPEGKPGFFSINFPSSVWGTTEGLMIDAKMERSLDGGVTWIPFGGMGNMETPGQFGSSSQSVGPDGATTFPSLDVSWDGQAMLLKGTYITTVSGSPAAFSHAVVIVGNQQNG